MSSKQIVGIALMVLGLILNREFLPLVGYILILVGAYLTFTTPDEK